MSINDKLGALGKLNILFYFFEMNLLLRPFIGKNVRDFHVIGNTARRSKGRYPVFRMITVNLEIVSRIVLVVLICIWTLKKTLKMTASTPAEIGKHPAYSWVMLSCCFIAVLLNMVVIFAVVKFGRYLASIDIFVTNLAASDIIHAGIVTPVHFKNDTDQHFYGDNVVCKLFMFIPLLSVMGGILTIVAIAIDRYRVIVAKQQLYRRGAITATIAIWTASFLVSAPQLYEYNVYLYADEDNPNTTYTSCGSEGIVEHFETIYATLVFIFAFLIPLAVVLVCYTKIFLYVWEHGRRFRRTQLTLAGTGSSNSRQYTRTDKMLSTRMIKMLRMLIWITTTFIGLWTPYFIIFGITEIMGIDDTSNFSEWPYVVSRAMTVFSTISNPVLYLAFSDTFRRVFCDVSSCNPTMRCPSWTRSNKVKPTNQRDITPSDTNREGKSVSLRIQSVTTKSVIPGNIRTSFN